MVDRKCPTCISLAILGDEKSTMIRCLRCWIDDDDDIDDIPNRFVRSLTIVYNARDKYSFENLILINPGPAISMGTSMICCNFGINAVTIVSAIIRGVVVTGVVDVVVLLVLLFAIILNCSNSCMALNDVANVMATLH